MTKIKNFVTTTSVTLFLAASMGCASSHNNLTTAPPALWNVERYDFTDRPEIGKMPSGEAIHLGGFSGLVYARSEPDGSQHHFLTITDRGPNGDILKMRHNNDYRRPFLIPKFSPTIVYLTANTNDHSLRVTKRILLKSPNGSALTGLPPPKPDIHGDLEIPVDPAGNPLQEDFLGLDPECLAVDKDGSFWVGEEYRPAILNFSKTGILRRMYVPEGYFSDADMAVLKKRFGTVFVRQILPKELRYRAVNRGFEGLTIKMNRIIATLQSPIERSEAPETFTRWIQLDPKTDAIHELRYQTSDVKSNRLGDLTSGSGSIYVIEQNGKTGPKSTHNIYSISDSSLVYALANGGTEPLTKTLFVDMVASGVHEFEKVEGVAALDENRIATLNDNDFGLTFEGEIGVDSKKPITLTIFSRPPERLLHMKRQSQ